METVNTSFYTAPSTESTVHWQKRCTLFFCLFTIVALPVACLRPGNNVFQYVNRLTVNADHRQVAGPAVSQLNTVVCCTVIKLYQVNCS